MMEPIKSEITSDFHFTRKKLLNLPSNLKINN
jgi:hypothetical protein